MSSGYRIEEQDSLHFVPFQIVKWIDIFTRKIYRNIVIDGTNQINEKYKMNNCLMQARTLAFSNDVAKDATPSGDYSGNPDVRRYFFKYQINHLKTR